MSHPEWEALCDGCGKCCLHKLIDDDTDKLYYTDIACRLLDLESVTCKDYDNRRQQVPDCLSFNCDNIGEFDWLPSSCAYRTLHEGRQLEAWHPLESGTKSSVHKHNQSICGHCVSETEVDPDRWQEHLIMWI